MNFFANYWALLAAIWYFINGLLHDIAVIKRHEGGYDRELLRLLMDGHVLLLSGILSFICYVMMRQNLPYGWLIGIIVSVGMLVYCAMIFPFLKSFGTLLVSLILLIVCLRGYFSF